MRASPPDWPAAQERLRGPAFEPIAPLLARLDAARWPTHEALNGLAAGIATARGLPLRFVAPRAQRDRGTASYERRIAASGEVETRPGNWHDLFNALAWMAFPRAKAAINAQHAAMLEAGGERETRCRNPARDALALFDEGGVIVASSSPELLQLIVDFEWKDLFWRRRDELSRHMRFIAFGHSLFEKMLDPFVGIVAKTVFLPVGEDFVALAPARQIAQADARLAAHFASRERFASPRAMAPLPVLGIPGWHPGTEVESWYDDRGHFRSKAPKEGSDPVARRMGG